MSNINLKKTVAILIPVFAVIILLLQDPILSLVPYVPACSIYAAFNVYCPACGNTRSVTALFHGDLMTSLRYNIVPLLLILLIALGYIELVFSSFGRPVRLLPRRLSFYLILIGLLIAYWIIRNFFPYLTP